MTIRATQWEFRNRAWLIGMLFGVAFLCYSVDHQNIAAAAADEIAGHTGLDANRVVRTLFVLAAAIASAAALVRSWASAYLHRDIVYAADVKSASLVADGPYRYVRNPLYLGNLLLALGVGALESRLGFVLLVAGMYVFCYRLVRREEWELRVAGGDSYEAYTRAVPRFWPALGPRVPQGRMTAQWTAGFKAELWFWPFPLGILALAITLNQRALWGVMLAGLLACWIYARLSK